MTLQENIEFVKNLKIGGTEEDVERFALMLHLGGIWRNPIPSETNFKNLCTISKIFNKNDINYSVAWGTLLGLVRDRKLIDKDEDIDLFANTKDYDLIKNAALKNGFLMVPSMFYETHPTYNKGACDNSQPWFLVFFKVCDDVGCYIDISFYEDKGKDHVTVYACEPWQETKEEKIKNKHYIRLPKKIFFPLKEMDIKGYKIKGPWDPIAVAEWSYGSSWKQTLKKSENYKWETINGTPKITLLK